MERNVVDPRTAHLYGGELAEDLASLRALVEEKATLQALRDKVFQATGGRIVYRGKETSRQELPALIRSVGEEEETVRKRIIAHDRRARSSHIALAAQIGQGWREYLIGLIQVLHYAEHSLADLRDAQGLLSNVWAVVTADGKVSSRERKRLISTGNELYKVLALVHSLKDKILLDSGLLTRLGAESWEATLDAFKLPPATNDNLQQWITVIDGWVNSAADSLSALVGVTLEQLLWTEVEVARHGRELSNVAGNTGVASHIIATAPSPSVVPSQYPALLQGQERKRQQRLGIWDRFQTADGLLPGIARLVIAVAIVGSVLGFAYVRHSTNDLSIYNGLGIPVEV